MTPSPILFTLFHINLHEEVWGADLLPAWRSVAHAGHAGPHPRPGQSAGGARTHLLWLPLDHTAFAWDFQQALCRSSDCWGAATGRCRMRAPCATCCGRTPTTAAAGASPRAAPATPLGRCGGCSSLCHSGTAVCMLAAAMSLAIPQHASDGTLPAPAWHMRSPGSKPDAAPSCTQCRTSASSSTTRTG